MNAVSPSMFVLNLDRSRDRLERFRRLNSHLRDVSRIQAVDGALANRDALVEEGLIATDLTYPPGALGCALSHVRMWKLAIERSEPITVFEDDAVVSADFGVKAPAVLREVPNDWDFVLWGYRFNPSYVWIDLGRSKARLTGYGVSRLRNEEQVTEFQRRDKVVAPLKLLHAFGTHGYSITPEGARIILKYALPLRKRMIWFPEAGVNTPDLSIDVALSGIYPLMKSYLVIEELASYLDEFPSDVGDTNKRA